MNISLTPELEELVNQKVQSGFYNSASEVIREGLRLLKERDELRRLRFEELKREVAIGIEQIERGEFTTYTSAQALADAIKDEGRQRLGRQTRSKVKSKDA